MFGWGMVSTFQIFINSTWSFYLTRALIGMFEGGWVPGVIVYLGKFYTSNELALRLPLFWTCNLLASGISGILAFGILRMHGLGGLSGWQWLFLIEGSFTVLVSFCAFAYTPANLPSMNHKWWNLDQHVRLRAWDRLIKEDPSKTHEQGWIGWLAIWKTLSDPTVWPIVLIGFFGFAPTAGYALFLPYIVKSLGFGALEANVILLPGGALAIVLTIVFGWASQKTHRRWFFVPIGNFIYIVGLTMSLVIPTTSMYAQYAACLIAITGFMPWHGVVAAWLSENSAPEDKRAIAISLYIIFVNVSGVAGAQFYRAGDAPRYFSGHLISICFLVVCSCCAVGQRLYLGSVNKKREAMWVSLSVDEQREELAKPFANTRLDFRFNY